MAVMTSHLPSPIDVYSQSPPTPSASSSNSPVLRNRRSLKNMLANSTPRSSVTSDMQGPARPVVSHLPLLPAAGDGPKTQPRARKISHSNPATSPVRPSPRFHVTNPTELPTPPKSSESSRPLPAPILSIGEGHFTQKQPGSPPRIHINTTGLHAQSPHSPVTSNPSPYPSGSTSSAPSTSSSSSFTAKAMSKVSLPIGPKPARVSAPVPLPLSDASFHSGRTTPVASLPSPTTSGCRAGVRPLPPPPPLAKGPSVSGPRTRSTSREHSATKARSRTNSSAGRADASTRPQLTFDPTSSSYVIRTAGELNNHIHTAPSNASAVGFDKGRTARVHTHNRSRSAQFRNFSSMVLPDVRDIRDTPSYDSSGRHSTGGKGKGKQAVRSAPCSDTEDSSLTNASKNQQSRPRLILHNPSDSTKQSVHSAPNSDIEDSTLLSYSSSLPSSNSTKKKKKTELVSPLLLPPTGSIKDMLAAHNVEFYQPQPIKSTPLFPQKLIPTAPITRTHTSPPAQGIGFRVVSPPSLPSLSEDIGHADSGYVDDSRVYIDDGYDGPGGLGAFSTSVDPDVDADIGEMEFSMRPPSGEFMVMGASVMDLDMDARGRHVSRPGASANSTLRWQSADPRAADADLQRRKSGKGTTGSNSSHSHSHSHSHISTASKRSASQTVILSSLKAQMQTRPVPAVELGPAPIDMDLEPEMVFSKNPMPSSFKPTHPVPGVLDTDRIYVRGKWRSPSPLTPPGSGKNDSFSDKRYPVSGGQFAPVRSRGFYEDW